MTKRNTLLKGFLATAVLGSATLVGCGGSSRAPIDTSVATISGTLNLAQVAGRSASANPSGFRLVAVSTTANPSTVSVNLGGTETAATFSLTLPVGHKWTIRFARIAATGGNVFLFPLAFPTASGASSVLPLDGTLAVTTFNLGTFDAETIATAINTGSPIVVSATNNPLAQITSGGQNYATSTTLATDLATAETTLNTAVATADSGTGSQCSVLTAKVDSFTATAGAGGAVTITGVGLPTTAVYAALISGSDVVTGFGATQNVNRSNVNCVATSTAAVPVTGTSTSLGFTVPAGATAGATGTLAIFTAPTGLTPSKLLRLGTFTVASPTTVAPTITSTFPANGATNIPANTTQGLVEFSKAMNTTLTPTMTVQVTNTSTGGTVVTAGTNITSIGSIAWQTDGRALGYTLNTGAFTLNAGSAYSYTITVDASTIRDTDGNNLNLTGSSSSLSGATVTNTTGTTFTITGTFTVTAADTTAPTITSTSPANGATVAANTTTGTINFSEVINTTLTPNITVQVTNTSTGGTVVTAGTNITSIGSVTWANDGQSLTYTLTNSSLTLNSGSSYSYVITIDASTIKDAVGNNLNLTGSNLSGATVANTTGTTFTVSGTFSVQ